MTTRWAVEVTPKWVLSQASKGLVHPGLKGKRVNVAFLPTQSENNVVQACRFLKESCLAKPVCHVPARKFVDGHHVSDFIHRLAEVGVRDHFAISGDGQPSGEIKDSVDLLKIMHDMQDTFDSIGFAAYPDGHASMSDATLDQALIEKAEMFNPGKGFAVTQLCLKTQSLVSWDERLFKRTPELDGFPVWVGIFGPVKLEFMRRLSQRLGFSKALDLEIVERERANTDGKLHGSDDLVREVQLLATTGKLCMDIRGFQVSTFDDVDRSLTWINEV